MRLCLDTLHVDGADIRLGASDAEEEPPKDGDPFRLHLPFPIELRSVLLNDVVVQLADGTRINWSVFETSATAEQSRLAFAPSRLEQLTVYLPPSPGVLLTQEVQTPLMAEGIDGAILLTQPRDEALQPISPEEQLATRERIELPEIVLPVDIEVSDLTATDINLTGAFEYHVERLQVGLNTQESQVEITSLEVTTDDVQANLVANADLTGSYPLEARLEAVLFLPELFPELNGEELVLELSGSLEDLQAELTASGIVAASLNARVDVLAPDVPFQARLQSERLQWPLVEEQPAEGASGTQPYVVEAVDLTVEGSLEAYHAAVSLQAQGPELPLTQLTLTGDGDFSHFRWDPLVLQVGENTLRSEGHIDWSTPDLPFQARLQSERLQWPLVDEAQEADGNDAAPYVVEAVDLTVEGSLDAYRAEVSLQAQGAGLPPTQVTLTGDGDVSHFRWDPLALQVEESTLSSEGRIDWLDPLTIDTRIRLDQFDPAHFVDQMNGNLTGDIELSVRQLGDLWSVSIANIDINGQLRDYPLTLQAALDANSNLEVDIHELLFTQGNNRLEASGQVSQQAMSLNADIALRELRTLSPELAGTLTGNVQATGSFEQPEILADLSGRDLRFADNRVEQLELDATVQGLEDPRINVQLGLQQIFAGGQRLSTANMDLTGQLSQHRLELRVQGDPNSPLQRALLALDGRFDQQRQQYQGRLTPLEIDSEAGNIRLEAPLELGYNLTNGQARLSPFCLRREEGGLVCSQEPINASADQGRAVLTVREVPMEMLEPFLPDEWSFEGATTADATVAWRQGGARWQADVQVLSELAITAINDYGQPVQLPGINLDAQIQANQSQADANMLLSFSEAGDLTLNLSLNDPLGQGRLDGELLANNLSLEPYRPMVINMDRLEGAIDGRVQIGGTTRQPDLQGSLALRGLRLHGPDIPLEVRDGELTISFDGEQGDINGFLAAERGRLNITGDAYWPGADDWRIGVDLNATQDPLLLVLPQFGRLEAAPDIRVRITPERLQVRGNVDLPWARLEIGSRSSSTIEPSSDEIIITERDDREAEQAELRAADRGEPSAADELVQTGMEMDVLITLTLGQDMLLSAYGLESGLGGTLEIRQDSGGLQLFGDVNLVDGRFQAFGQDLFIRRGQLLFSGPPSLPTLDFEAIRNPDVTEDDVIAGLRVTGNAEEPNVMIFSEPSMGETQALSYLLRGRAPDSGGGMDSALTTALIGMSLGRTGGAVGSIGEAFGIDDLTLDTTGAGDESQVALSGQLTDDLRISYGVGIFSPIAELTLRYTLWRNLYAQAVSGANQAVDLIYTFSRRGDPVIYKQQ
ncbi:translocation/assembly module TamB [Vreelandella populi]|uniref:Translocation/assembly module TamB n=2 Tax=Vreelandella populi TaxID=2498858 RepID=A0A433L8W2_9GAMM|nr:translocation/assembly module TamB [Halomonas populi]RUR43638.1 translocation/assembly module TamB [Halomonas populi]RUR51704.1 translocation/assembly module TamB [Halomonas populi]